MAYYASVTELAVETLRVIERNAKKDAEPNGDTPATLGWEKYLATYPVYGLGKSASAVELAKNANKILRRSSESQARLAGALIRQHLYDDELHKIAGRKP